MPSGELFVNGALVDKLPLEKPVRVPAGAARIEVRASGHAPSRSDVTLPAGLTTELSLEVERLPTSMTEPTLPAAERPSGRIAVDAPANLRPWIYSSAGVGVLGVSVGVVAAAVTFSKKAQRDELCGAAECPRTKDGEDAVALDGEARTALVVSQIGFGAGIVGAGAAVVLWLVERRMSRRASPTPGFTAQVSSTGATVHGAFGF